MQKFNLSHHNQIKDKHIPRSQLTYRIERIEKKVEREGESSSSLETRVKSSSESINKMPALDRLGPKEKPIETGPTPEKSKQSSQD